jgi:hypothetical protein
VVAVEFAVVVALLTCLVFGLMKFASIYDDDIAGSRNVEALPRLNPGCSTRSEQAADTPRWRAEHEG